MPLASQQECVWSRTLKRLYKATDLPFGPRYAGPEGQPALGGLGSRCQSFQVRALPSWTSNSQKPLLCYISHSEASLLRPHVFLFVVTFIEEDQRKCCCGLCQVFFLFSSRIFTVSSLTFRSLIHFEFISVCGVRECSDFTLLPIAIQSEETVFSPL